MQLITRHNLGLAFVAFFALASCSEKKAKQKPAAVDSDEIHRKSTPVIAPEPELKLPAKVTENLSDALTSRFQKLRREGPKIPTYIEIHNDMWTVELSQPTASPDPLGIINSAPPKRDLIQTLRNGGTIEGIDRKIAAAYMGLVTGWLMDTEDNQDIHFLFAKRSASPEIASGDVVLATIVAEVSEMATASKGFTGSQPKEWAQIAKGSNPIMRQIAAALVFRLTTDLKDQSEFALNYGDEKEIAVIRTLASSLQKMPKENSASLISQLAALQENSGNAEGARYLNSLLSQ